MFSPEKIRTAEVDHGIVIVDRKPWQTSWIQKSENCWCLVSRFDKGKVTTYFTEIPPKLSFGIHSENKPVKQEFEFYFTDKTVVSKKFQFEKFPDGAWGLVFSYDDTFVFDGKKLHDLTVSIFQEPDGAPGEIRYSLFKNYE